MENPQEDPHPTTPLGGALMVASMPAPAYAGGMSPGIRVSHGGRAHGSCRVEVRMQFSLHHRGLKPFLKDILVTILGNLQSTP